MNTKKEMDTETLHLLVLQLKEIEGEVQDCAGNYNDTLARGLAELARAIGHFEAVIDSY